MVPESAVRSSLPGFDAAWWQLLLHARTEFSEPAVSSGEICSTHLPKREASGFCMRKACVCAMQGQRLSVQFIISFVENDLVILQ